MHQTYSITRRFMLEISAFRGSYLGLFSESSKLSTVANFLTRLTNRQVKRSCRRRIRRSSTRAGLAESFNTCCEPHGPLGGRRGGKGDLSWRLSVHIPGDDPLRPQILLLQTPPPAPLHPRPVCCSAGTPQRSSCMWGRLRPHEFVILV